LEFNEHVIGTISKKRRRKRESSSPGGKGLKSGLGNKARGGGESAISTSDIMFVFFGGRMGEKTFLSLGKEGERQAASHQRKTPRVDN